MFVFLLNQSMHNAAQVWEVKSNKNMGSSLLKVTGGAWGNSNIKRLYSSEIAASCKLARYELCFTISHKCQSRTVYVVKSGN